MNQRHRSILRTHGYTRRHIKAFRMGLIAFHEMIRPYNDMIRSKQ